MLSTLRSGGEPVLFLNKEVNTADEILKNTPGQREPELTEGREERMAGLSEKG